MSFMPIVLPPGVYRKGTKLQSSAHFWLTNLVRWIGDALRPIGGWRPRNADAAPLIGMARAIMGWVDNSNDRWIVIGTHRKLYVQNEAGDFHDITPVRGTNSLGNDPIATIDGFTTITVTDTAHGGSVGEFVTLTGATAVGGLSTGQLNATFEILSVPDADSWTASVAGAPATSSAASGGAAVDAAYQIGPGEADGTVNTGFGYGVFGEGDFGTPRPDTGTIVPATAWQFTIWGERPLACAAYDGNIYEWALSTAGPFAILANAPVNCRSVLVTDDRITMALGAGGNPRKLQWSDQENNTSWTISTTNKAGDFEFNTDGRLMCGRPMDGATLILTDTDAWVATYVGSPLVYTFRRVGQGCGIVSQNAIAALDSQATWMGRENFWLYSAGFVQPLDCDIADFIFQDINTSQISKVTAFHNSAFSEVWFFYPSGAASENDRYVTWNYARNIWAMGMLSRLSAMDRGVFEHPLMMDAAGVLQEHEVGFNYDGAMPYAETGSVPGRQRRQDAADQWARAGRGQRR